MFEEESKKYGDRLHFFMGRTLVDEVTEETIDGSDTTLPGFALVIKIAGQETEIEERNDDNVATEINHDGDDDIEIGIED